MAIHISDPETVTLVRRLARTRSIGVTEAVNTAVRNELHRNGVTTALEEPNTAPPPDDRDALIAALNADIRSTTLEYTRLKAKDEGKKNVGSRVYQMLSRRGAIETLRRLVNRPVTTEGFAFLDRIGRIDLTAEAVALNPKYASIMPEDIVACAGANLGASREREHSHPEQDPWFKG
jgi:hypothetical protein